MNQFLDHKKKKSISIVNAILCTVFSFFIVGNVFAQQVSEPSVSTQVIKGDGLSVDTSTTESKDNQVGADFEVIAGEKLDIKDVKIDSVVGNVDMTKFDPEFFSALEASIKFLIIEIEGDPISKTSMKNDIEKLMLDFSVNDKKTQVLFFELSRRGKMMTFLIGPKFTTIRDIKKQNIELKQVISNTQFFAADSRNARLKDSLIAYTAQLEAKKVDNEKNLLIFEKKRSMFGWFFKLFVR